MQAASLIAVLAMTAAGCAAIQNREAIHTERMLAAAGFQMKFADTPEKLAHLETLTQRKIVPHQRDGKTYFVYADATSCKCLYAGDQEAYQRYEKILTQKRIADEKRMAADMNENAAMDWGMWGPWWGPW